LKAKTFKTRKRKTVDGKIKYLSIHFIPLLKLTPIVRKVKSLSVSGTSIVGSRILRGFGANYFKHSASLLKALPFVGFLTLCFSFKIDRMLPA
jgi:hypothetical protein